MNRALVILALAAATPAWAEPDAAALERLVLQDCGSCHGLTLKGGLGPDIRTGALGHHDNDSLARVILDGIPGTPMPPWRPLLSEAEARWIAAYLLERDPG
ncbi:cytochrome c55X [Roseovarius sp. MBR-78]|uniref:c-type cytochrome n=1 Tax=Roseovarius sp. MBR-78 TaxID=3156460 RepID=UPI00339933CC